MVFYYAHALLIELFDHVLGHMAKLQLLTLAFKQHVAHGMSNSQQTKSGNGGHSFAAISRPANATQYSHDCTNWSTCKVFDIRHISRISACFLHVEI